MTIEQARARRQQVLAERECIQERRIFSPIAETNRQKESDERDRK